MTKTLTAHIQRKHAERELFDARRTLSHLINIYDSGKWHRFYSEDVFIKMVRQARESVDYWTDVLSKCDPAQRATHSRFIPNPATALPKSGH
jgi:hypothetical protein